MVDELTIETNGTVPDWDASRAGIATLELEQLEQLGFAFGDLSLSKDGEARQWLDRAREILSDDLAQAIRWIEEGGSEPLVIDGERCEGIERRVEESGVITLTARGVEQLQSSEQATQPLWRLHRAFFSGLLPLSGAFA